MFHGFCKIFMESGGTQYGLTRHNNKIPFQLITYILCTVQWNAGTQVGFQVEYQGESKDLMICGVFFTKLDKEYTHYINTTVGLKI